MATADTTKPTLTSLSFPKTVDVKNGGKYLTFTAGASDVGLGVDYVYVGFTKSWQSSSSRTSAFVAYDSTDSYADGVSSREYYIDATSGAGKYSISNVTVYDKAGNYRYYEASELAAMGIATSFEVESNQLSDSTKPVLTSLSFPSSVDVTDGGKYLTFTASASDVGLGVDYVYVGFNKSWQSSSSRTSAFVAYDSTDSYADGASSREYYIEATSGAGTYSISNVTVYDKAGNYRYYEASELSAMGIATSFEIESNQPSDSTKPVLTSLSFPSSVDVTDGGKYLTFTASASDVGLGVDYVYVGFTKSWQSSSSRTSAFVAYDSTDSYADGASSREYYIDATSGAGTYSIGNVTVYDKAGNYRYYEASELSAMGIATSFEILDFNAGVTATVAASGVVAEGTGATLIPLLTLKNIGAYTGTVTLAFDAEQSTMTASEVNVPNFNGLYSISQSPARDYVIDLPAIGVIDDLLIEGDEILAFKVAASGQIFSSGSDNIIVKVTIADNDRVGTVGNDVMNGDEGHNLFVGLAGNDVLNGFGGDDWLQGGLGHDRLNGGFGNDRLDPGAGNNIVDGGAGSDMLVLAGVKASYSYLLSGGWTFVVGEEGASRTVNVEQVAFANGVLGSADLAGSLSAFDGLRYIAGYGDLIAAFGSDADSATAHYVASGFAEGRDAKEFDALDYIAGYDDLIAAFGTDTQAATSHYIDGGFVEGRSDALFDGLQYIASYADLIEAFGTDADAGARHFIQDGRDEGRSDDLFDGLQYVASHGDLIGAIGTDVEAAAEHFIKNGYGEGRMADDFDGLRYIASNADLIVALGDDDDAAARHYILAGQQEGRDVDGFDALAYAAANPDLAAAFGTDVDALTEHYIDTGYFEHRVVAPGADMFMAA